jgi:ribosomal protein L7/L12
MARESIYLTRREFYTALGIVWLYIFLVLGDLVRLQERSTTIILMVAALLMTFVYVGLGLRGPGVTSDKPPPLSDRVKELASDPSRKIEAIKAYREETGAGLAEAKAAVEAYQVGP